MNRSVASSSGCSNNMGDGNQSGKKPKTLVFDQWATNWTPYRELSKVLNQCAGEVNDEKTAMVIDFILQVLRHSADDVPAVLKFLLCDSYPIESKTNCANLMTYKTRDSFRSELAASRGIPMDWWAERAEAVKRMDDYNGKWSESDEEGNSKQANTQKRTHDEIETDDVTLSFKRVHLKVQKVDDKQRIIEGRPIMQKYLFEEISNHHEKYPSENELEDDGGKNHKMLTSNSIWISYLVWLDFNDNHSQRRLRMCVHRHQNRNQRRLFRI